MYRLRAGFIALLAIALGFGLTYQADAQTTTGKISGRITDSGTGEPLPGANVVIVGTRMGATADVNGEYFIIRVNPGVYEVTASLVGYRAVTQRDVAVSIDRTTPLNFSLGETTAELAEITVTAERPPVEMDVSYTQVIMSAKEIEAPPVGPRLRDAFATQVGVDTDSWGLNIRGGNETEIVYMVDGVSMKDSRDSRPYSSFSKTALQEVQILKGGFNAEYGDVRSGVINVVNREPRAWTTAGDLRWSPAANKYFGPTMYSTDNWWDVGRFQSMSPTADRDGDGNPDFAGWNNIFADKGGPAGEWKAGPFEDVISTPQQAKGIWDFQHRKVGGIATEASGIGPFGQDEDYPYQQNFDATDRDADYTYDVTVGGPLVQDKVSFLLSTRREKSAYTWTMAVPNYRDDTWQAKAIFTPTATTKLSLGFLKGWSQGAKYGNFLGTFARTPAFEVSNLRTRNIFAMGSGSNIETIDRNYGTMTWTHTLSPRTFYNLTVRVGKADFEASWQPLQKRGEPAAAVYPDGRVEEVTESSYQAAQAAGAVILDEGPKGFTYKPGTFDLLGAYRMRGGDGNPARSGDWSYTWEDDYTFDITSQVTPNHQIKAGVQVHHFFLREVRGFASSVQDPSLEDVNFRPGNIDDPANMEVTDTADFHNYWVRTPLYGGVFLQDRMEYRQIVVNAGLRLDFHRPDKYFDIPNEVHAEWMGSNAVLLYSKAEAIRPPTKWKVSPRVGISHPITAESKLFFNYGHFAQIPTSVDLYQTQSGLGEPLEQFGNPWLDMPVTIAYELGYERNFANQYLFNGTVFFKDIEKDTERGRVYIQNTTGRSTRFHMNGNVKDIRGFELSVRKARGQFVTGFLSYEFRAERKRIVRWERIYDAQTVSTASYRLIESSPAGANPRFKARPILKFGLNFRTPLDYGGEQRMLKGGWEANLYYRHQAGSWFNYNPSNDVALRSVDNAQWQATRLLDLRFAKMFDVKMAPTVYLEIRNPLNFKNVTTTSTSRIWDTRSHLGTSSGNNFKKYMEALGWTVDASGNLQEGDKPGKELDESVMSQRSYLFYVNPRDIHLGVRWSF